MDGATLSPEKYSALADFIQQNFGIKMPPAKKIMLEARLRRRMVKVGYDSLDSYLAYVFGPVGKKEEYFHMIDAITTNKTDFFREPVHFDILVRSILPEIMRRGAHRHENQVALWSAACSTGEEPYTLAMLLLEFFRSKPEYDFSILASDLSCKALTAASRGIYREELVADIPLDLKKKYLLKSRDRSLKLVQVKEELKDKVTYKRINLMGEEFGIRERFHIIFLRNVMIYFQKDDQTRLLRKMAARLKPGGFLFTGHSESIAGLDVPFVAISPSVYRVREGW